MRRKNIKDRCEKNHFSKCPEGTGFTDRYTILMGYLFFMELIGTIWGRKAAPLRSNL